MSEQVVSPESESLLSRRFTSGKLLGSVIWSIAAVGLMALLIVRIGSAVRAANVLVAMLGLLPVIIGLAYLAGYLIPLVRQWYIAPTPAEQWTPQRRASGLWEAWATHLPQALLGFVLITAGLGAGSSVVVASTQNRHWPLVLAAVMLVYLGMGTLLFLRSTALGWVMQTTVRGRRWFYGGMALLLVPLAVLLAAQTLGTFSAGILLSVLGMLVFAYSLGVSALTSYGVRTFFRDDVYQALSGIIPAPALDTFKAPPRLLTWQLRHRVFLLAWLPFMLFLAFLLAASLFYLVGAASRGSTHNAGLSFAPGGSAGAFLFAVAICIFLYFRLYRGLRLHAYLLEAQAWQTVPVTPGQRRALAYKIAPAFSVTVLLAGLACGLLMEVLGKAGVFAGAQFWLRSVAGPVRASDAGGDFLRWLAAALPDLLVYAAALAGAFTHASVFFSRPFKRGQLAWQKRMLAQEETRRNRIWATLIQRMGSAADDLAEPDQGGEPPDSFPSTLSDGMLALVYELSKERVERYKQISLHPFGQLGWLRSIVAALLLALPGFLLNHLNWISQFFP